MTASPQRKAAAEKLAHLAAELHVVGDSAQAALVQYAIAAGFSYEGPSGLFLRSARDVLRTAVRLDPSNPERWLLLAGLEWRVADHGMDEMEAGSMKRAAEFARCAERLAVFQSREDLASEARAFMGSRTGRRE